jgi:hypothetical protein
MSQPTSVARILLTRRNRHSRCVTQCRSTAHDHGSRTTGLPQSGKGHESVTLSGFYQNSKLDTRNYDESVELESYFFKSNIEKCFFVVAWRSFVAKQ